MAYRSRRSTAGRRSYRSRGAPRSRTRRQTTQRRRSPSRRYSARPQEVRIVVEQPGPRPMAETKKAPPRRF